MTCSVPSHQHRDRAPRRAATVSNTAHDGAEVSGVYLACSQARDQTFMKLWGRPQPLSSRTSLCRYDHFLAEGASPLRTRSHRDSGHPLRPT